MPYQDITELPENVRSVLYKDPDKRRDSADREQVAHRAAWSAVKRKYEQGENGQWQPNTE